MGKSILVIDTPECCDYCPAGRIFGMAGQVECRASETLHVNSNGRTVPSWCPLREMPERADHPNYCDNGRYDNGWNDCLGKILNGG